MMRKTLIIGFALVAGSACASAFDPLVALDAYDIVWQTPGNGERDMMPLGNGVVGLMLWTCADGRVEFYLARQDALTETDRIVKLGKVSLKLSPNPFKGRGFMQALRLRDGMDTKNPLSPSITFKSRMMKLLSNTIVAYALSLLPFSLAG